MHKIVHFFFDARFYRTFLAFIFSACLLKIATDWYEVPPSIKEFPTILIVQSGMLFTYLVWKTRIPSGLSRKVWVPEVWISIFFAVSTISILPFIFIFELFGTTSFGTSLFTVLENSPKDLLSIGFKDFFKPSLEYFLLLSFMLIGGYVFVRWIAYFWCFALILSISFIITNPFSHYMYRYIVPNPDHALLNLDVDFKRPVITKRPSKQKNILYVYLESLERTYRDIPETADAFKQFAIYEDQALSFNELHQSHGLNYTAAGMVGTQCGVPLVPNGIRNIRKQVKNVSENQVLKFNGFMGNMYCLGDILSEDGYIGSYVNGSDTAVFSKGLLFNSHGWERTFGINNLPGTREERYENPWGLNDDTVFEYAKKELEYLANTNRPFMMSMLTISTHGPNAFLDESCNYPEIEKSGIPAAIYCSGQHVKSIFEKLDELNIRDDTIVVLLSDHLAMKNTLKKQLKSAKQSGLRRQYAAIIGTEKNMVISKTGTTMDLYPTILEVLGYEIEDGHANLGVSLFNNKPTLAGRSSDPENISPIFKQNLKLRDLLWSRVED
jgi:phosphoglycerol transferase